MIITVNPKTRYLELLRGTYESDVGGIVLTAEIMYRIYTGKLWVF